MTEVSKMNLRTKKGKWFLLLLVPVLLTGLVAFLLAAGPKRARLALN